jgi:hypothetical protein
LVRPNAVLIHGKTIPVTVLRKERIFKSGTAWDYTAFLVAGGMVIPGIWDV